jgi:hypothetical protein
LGSLNKTRLFQELNSKPKILTQNKSFQLQHLNLISFGKIKCLYLEHKNLSKEEIEKLPLETFKKLEEDQNTQIFDRDTLEENSNAESTQGNANLEESTQIYEDPKSNTTFRDLESTQIYETRELPNSKEEETSELKLSLSPIYKKSEDALLDDISETPPKLNLVLQDTPTSKNGDDSDATDDTQTSDKEDEGGIFKNLNFENTMDTTSSTLNETFHIGEI